MNRPWTRVPVALLLLSLPACGDSVMGSVNDTEPPTVEISSPAGGAITGAITIVVTAMDNFGVKRVTIDINGATFAQDDTAPFEFPFDPAVYGAGTYTFRAHAVDAANNATTSANVTYTYSP